MRAEYTTDATSHLCVHMQHSQKRIPGLYISTHHPSALMILKQYLAHGEWDSAHTAASVRKEKFYINIKTALPQHFLRGPRGPSPSEASKQI